MSRSRWIARRCVHALIDRASTFFGIIWLREHFFLHFIQSIKSITLVLRWRHPRIHRGKISGSQPAKAEIARERTLLSISRKNKTKGSCDATKKKHIRISDRFSNTQEKNYQSKIVFQVVLSGMPRNNVYKNECCNYTLGFKETWKW